MGMFDEVVGRCKCGCTVAVQSKAGDCCLGNYDVESVPVAVAADVNGKTVTCSRCGATCTFEFPVIASSIGGRVSVR